MQEKKYLTWGDVDITWDDFNMSWDDVSIFIEVNDLIINRGGGYSDYVKNNPWKRLKEDIGEIKTQKLIKLYCSYKNIEFNDQRILNKDIKVTAKDFKKFIDTSIENSIKINISF